MEVPLWRDRLAGTAAAFVADLEARGFQRQHDDSWLGPIPIPAPGGGIVSKLFRIEMPDTFPFIWPRVLLPKLPAALTWHLNPSGELCLFRASDNLDRPWATVQGLFDRVAFWHDQNAKGWPDDPGDPDLDRYFKNHDNFFVTYDSSEHAVGPLVAAEVNKDWWHVSISHDNRQRRREKRSLWWFGVDLGVLAKPIWNWSTLHKALPREMAADIESLATADDGVLLAHYQRKGIHGPRQAAIALFLKAPRAHKPQHQGRRTLRPSLNANAEPVITTLQLADDSEAAQWYRAGPEAGILKAKHVAIIGCGAVGSFTADLLARSGIGEITLVDGERLVPGNCVRHVADRRHVPKRKVDAVKDILVEQALLPADRIHVKPTTVTAEMAAALLMNTDLVIDATGNAAVSGLLRHLGHQIGRVSFLKVGIHREGGLIRVDRFGEGTREDADRPPFINAIEGTEATYREAGCGDPVSSTPPPVIVHAASTVTRFAVDYLRPANQRQLSDAQVEVLTAQPDDPWTMTGIHTGPPGSGASRH